VVFKFSLKIVSGVTQIGSPSVNPPEWSAGGNACSVEELHAVILCEDALQGFCIAGAREDGLEGTVRPRLPDPLIDFHGEVIIKLLLGDAQTAEEKPVRVRLWSRSRCGFVMVKRGAA
jgi:hypothetical protein